MTPTRGSLPPLIAEIADIVGEEKALGLIVAFGGQEIRIPLRPRKGQVLVERVGMDVARALSAMRGGEKVPIPNGAALRSKRRAVLAAKGSVSQIVRQTGATARWVRKVKNAEPQPLPLFDRPRRD